MINEKFLESAVRIRREFLKINTSLDMYHRRAKQIVEGLEDISQKADSLLKEIDEDKKSQNPQHTKESAVAELLKILQDLEHQGEVIEELTNPMNQEIEKLAKEEQELYRQIKEVHRDISDEKLIKIIKDRLDREGLS